MERGWTRTCSELVCVFCKFHKANEIWCWFSVTLGQMSQGRVTLWNSQCYELMAMNCELMYVCGHTMSWSYILQTVRQFHWCQLLLLILPLLTSIFPFNLFQYCLLYCMYVCIWFKVNRIKCVIYLNNTCIPRTVSSIYRVHIEQISNTYRVHIDQISNIYV